MKPLIRGIRIAGLALLDLAVMRLLIAAGWSFEWAFAAALFGAIAFLKTSERS